MNTYACSCILQAYVFVKIFRRFERDSCYLDFIVKYLRVLDWH